MAPEILSNFIYETMAMSDDKEMIQRITNMVIALKQMLAQNAQLFIQQRRVVQSEHINTISFMLFELYTSQIRKMNLLIFRGDKRTFVSKYNNSKHFQNCKCKIVFFKK